MEKCLEAEELSKFLELSEATIYKLASKGKIPGGCTGGNPETSPGIQKDREKTKRFNTGKGGKEIGRMGPISGLLRSQTLRFTPTIRPIRVPKDISANG